MDREKDPLLHPWMSLAYFYKSQRMRYRRVSYVDSILRLSSGEREST
jgi:hypothetical protein